MTFSLLGHDRIVEHLRAARRRGRLGHALLFLGPEGVGRETCARGLAAGLLCEGDAEASLPFGCGECRACRRVLAGNHPDVHVLMSEAEAVLRGLEKPDGNRRPSREIRIHQVRELSRVMRMRPYEGRARIAIVVDAHLLNVSASNALLKTLEEPSGEALLILLAPHVRSVLPTLASRCQRLTFGPLPEEAVARVLAQRGIADAEERARRAEGSVGRALALDLEAAQGEERVVALLEQRLFEGSDAERLDAAEQVGRDRGEADRVLAGLERRLARELRAIARGESAPLRTSRDLLGALDAVAEARASLAQNAHVQLTLEALLLANPSAVAPRGGLC